MNEQKAIMQIMFLPAFEVADNMVLWRSQNQTHRIFVYIKTSMKQACLDVNRIPVRTFCNDRNKQSSPNLAFVIVQANGAKKLFRSS